MFADWINTVLDQIPFDLTGDEGPRWERGGTDFRTGDTFSHAWGATEIASLRNKKLCHDCNTKWMADLEGRARPLLTPMILGRPHTLNPDQQITAATWATKTVMVLETAMGDSSDPEDLFPADQREIVMDHDRPPGLLRVRAAALEGLLAPLRYGCCRLLVQREGVDLCHLHLYTLQINMLVLQVVRPDPPPPNYGALKELAVPDDIEVPLFPPVDGFFWPPKKSLSPEGLISYITRSDKPPTLPGPP